MFLELKIIYKIYSIWVPNIQLKQNQVVLSLAVISVCEFYECVISSFIWTKNTCVLMLKENGHELMHLRLQMIDG